MGKINITGGVKTTGKVIAKRLNLKPAWDTLTGSLGTLFENEVFSVTPGATDPDTFPDPALTYSVSSGSLPSGLSINSSTGEISGTVDLVGSDTTSNFTLRAADGPLGPEQQGKAVDRDFSITVLNNVAPSFDQVVNFSIGSVAELAAATLFQITASDPNTNPQAITFSEVGAVLTGESLSLDSSGNVTGTPPDSGGTRVVTFTVRASDGVLTTDQTYKLTITDSQDPVWVTSAGPLAAGSEGTAYSEFVVATDDNTIAYTISSGALPDGLSLNSSTGEISGTPTTSESASFEITVTDTIESDFTAQSFSIEISLVVENSLRFNDNDSAHLSRTPSASNRDTWTFSTWFKGNPINNSTIFSAGADSDNFTILRFTTFERIQYRQRDGGVSTDQLWTTQAFRDPAAWYHIILAVDTTDATEANRIRIYVNGDEITAFDGTLNYPAQNIDTDVNSAVTHRIGANAAGGSTLDGYLAETIFIDGQQLTPSAFGEFDSNGDWQPIAYAGTFGANGFHFDYAVAPGTGDGGGTDVSGNDNHFTDSGLAANDQVSDSPTNNYCVINAVDQWLDGHDLSNGNLDVSTSSLSADRRLQGTIGVTSGKWYYECSPTIVASSEQMGIGSADSYASGGAPTVEHVTYNSNGDKRVDSSITSYGATFASGDVIGIAFDIDGDTVEFFKNNVSQGSISYSFAAGKTWFPLSMLSNINNSKTFDFGQLGFTYTPPTGFLALNTSNLPTPTIENPSDYFNTKLYIGNGTTSTAITGVGFQPDLAWFKNRSTAARSHQLYDAVRGATKKLSSDANTNENTQAEGLQSFDADGFTVGTSVNVNESGNNIVAWNWKEGATPGFDIVSYTGTGSNRTVAHSLGAVPDMMIVKGRNTTSSNSWLVYHSSNTAAPETDFLILNLTSATTDNNTVWNDTAPTSSVFTVGTSASANEDTKNFITYLWAGVEGFSKFGSYTGNASTDGPFVWCGFKPAYVMIKRSNGAANWFAYDTARDTYNAVVNTQWPNLSDPDGVGTNMMDILSNGFKIRISANNLNASGGTYIFAAFAETPFKTARAR